MPRHILFSQKVKFIYKYMHEYISNKSFHLGRSTRKPQSVQQFISSRRRQKDSADSEKAHLLELCVPAEANPTAARGPVHAS